MINPELDRDSPWQERARSTAIHKSVNPRRLVDSSILEGELDANQRSNTGGVGVGEQLEVGVGRAWDEQHRVLPLSTRICEEASV